MNTFNLYYSCTSACVARLWADLMCNHSVSDDLKLSRQINFKSETCVWIYIDFISAGKPAIAGWNNLTVPGLETNLMSSEVFLYLLSLCISDTFPMYYFAAWYCAPPWSFTNILPWLIQIFRARLKSRRNPQRAVSLNTLNLILY